MCVAIKLGGVDEVVPDAVEASYEGCDRGEECVSHPDGEHRVFLTERLAGGDGIAVAMTYVAPDCELHHTAYQRYGYEAELDADRNVGAHDGVGRDRERQCESDNPEIEAPFLLFGESALKARQEASHKESCE